MNFADGLAISMLGCIAVGVSAVLLGRLLKRRRRTDSYAIEAEESDGLRKRWDKATGDPYRITPPPLETFCAWDNCSWPECQHDAPRACSGLPTSKRLEATMARAIVKPFASGGPVGNVVPLNEHSFRQPDGFPPKVQQALDDIHDAVVAKIMDGKRTISRGSLTNKFKARNELNKPCPWDDCMYPDCAPRMGCPKQAQTLADMQSPWRNSP